LLELDDDINDVNDDECDVDRGSDVPSPPAGHRWKEVRHDNTVSRPGDVDS